MAPATKRSRPDTDDEGPVAKSASRLPNPQEYPHFWFPDGNIVLQVEQTLFRVHSSILARYSQVFKDMLDISQASTANEPMYDGCPVVSLTDAADDVYEFLSLIYDGSKLGKKYQVDFFFDEGLEAMRSDYPKEIESWNPPDGVIQFNNGSWSESVRKLIKLAHELGFVLPSLYLDLGTGLSLATLIDDSGSTAVQLGPEIVKAIVTGRERLHAHLRDERVKYLRKISASDAKLFRDCDLSTSSICRNGRCDLFDDLSLWKAGPGVDAMAPSDLRPTVPTRKDGICRGCHSQIDDICKAIRLDTWARLPEFFGLGKWEDLKDEDL